VSGWLVVNTDGTTTGLSYKFLDGPAWTCDLI